MNAIERLMHEHRQIEKALSVLENIFDNSNENSDEFRMRLGRIGEYLDCFADTIHHGKEEKLLFKVMAEHGFSKEIGPISVMLAEHEQGRRFIQIIRAGVVQEKDWSGEDHSQLIQAGKGYAALLRNHIQKEDNVLFKMAQDALPDNVLSELSIACAAYDETHSEEITRLHKLLAEVSRATG